MSGACAFREIGACAILRKLWSTLVRSVYYIHGRYRREPAHCFSKYELVRRSSRAFTMLPLSTLWPLLLKGPTKRQPDPLHIHTRAIVSTNNLKNTQPIHYPSNMQSGEQSITLGKPVTAAGVRNCNPALTIRGFTSIRMRRWATSDADCGHPDVPTSKLSKCTYTRVSRKVCKPPINLNFQT